MAEDVAFDAFANESERARTLVELLDACSSLEEWRSMAQRPAALTPAQRNALAVGLRADDTAETKLARWATLFDDEIAAVFETRNRVVHGMRVSDKELRGATWLARHLLELLQPEQAA